MCRTCFYAEQTQIMDRRAEESLEAELPEGVRAAKVAKPPRPGRVMWTGIALCALGLLGGIGMLALVGEVEKSLFLVAAFGFATAARGYKVRHYQ